MKKYLFIALSGLMLWAMSACNPNVPVDPKPTDGTDTTNIDTTKQPAQIPSAFVKKHLIEEFTGQDCGYCPYGMDCVHDFIANDTNWIVVLHHYGYRVDNFSVAGSDKITSKMRVNGAPTITINRSPVRTPEGTESVFHPGYLPQINKSQFADSTYVGLFLRNDYDAATRKLTVHVSGAVCTEDFPLLKLTLMVKESGMIDYQADYNKTYEGWQEFRHANAVRAFLTDPLGSILDVDYDRLFAADYELTLNDAWDADNCMVVAFVSESFNPVVQAAQCPVVNGTTGGANILHGGITPVPVPDYYPEPGDNVSPQSLSGAEEFTMSQAQAQYTPYSEYGFNYWRILAYNTTTPYTINGTTCIPFAYIYVFTALDQTEIPIGRYDLSSSMEPGTAYAGFRDDEYMEIGGSTFYLTSLSYLNQGYLVPEAQWLIADGKLAITADGWALIGHARNGSEINIVGNSPIVNGGRLRAPHRITTSEEDHKPYMLFKIPTQLH